jgi:hypothetical protein
MMVVVGGCNNVMIFGNKIVKNVTASPTPPDYVNSHTISLDYNSIE